MSHSTVELRAGTEITSRPTALVPWQAGVVAAAFVLLWFEVVNHLRLEWALNPQYSYGWTVPFLALFLFYKRWAQRPAPAAPRWKPATIGLAILAALPLLPARILSIANPDWRLLSWGLALSGVIITLCALNLAGGLPWLRHFAFPVLFFLVATPWPAHFEQSVVQNLMRADASIVIEVLNAIGTVAIQRGNVIELSTGLVGIDDACTGVRSLQSTFMISLFLGEFYGMTMGRRVLLVVAAAALAFFCNLVRTLLLCLVASSSGIEAIHAWHDTAGLTILITCLVGLWLLCLWIAKGQKPNETVSTAKHTTAGFRLSGLAVTLALWVVLTEVSAAAWYSIRGHDLAATPSWTVEFPTGEKGYQPTVVADATKDMLRYNEGGGGSWPSSSGHQWLLYYFRWLPGRTAALFVKVHRPDVCLPASGMVMKEDVGIRLADINGIKMPIHLFRFEAQGQPLHIFYCYWDSRSSYENAASAAEEDWTFGGRLRAGWRGRREMGSQMVELAVWGHQNDEEAWKALTEQMAAVVRPVKG